MMIILQLERFFYYGLPLKAGMPKFLIFLLFCLFAIALGQLVPLLLKSILYLFDRKHEKKLYDVFVRPIQASVKICTALLLVYWSSQIWLDDYEIFSGFLEAFTSLIFFSATAWIISRILRQCIRIYGIRKLRNSGLNVNEILLVFETLANVLIGFFAVILFAESVEFPWVGIFAGASIGGVAIGLAVSKTAEEFVSTLLIYLDNRFLPGDYIRLPQMGDGRVEEVFGRVESIGWRSTTIRVAGKNTIYITTNAILASQEVENVSRGKKITVLLGLSFPNSLREREKALIEEVIIECTEKIYGLAANSTSIKFTQDSDHRGASALISFAILGSSESSTKLRKDILGVASEDMQERLRSFGLQFTAQEPNIYIETPVTI